MQQDCSCGKKENRMKPAIIILIVLILLYHACTYALFSVAFVRRRSGRLPFCRENTEFLRELNAFHDVMFTSVRATG